MELTLLFSLIFGIGFYWFISAIFSKGPSQVLTEPGATDPKAGLSDLPNIPLIQRAFAPLSDAGRVLSRQDPAKIEDQLRRSGWRYRSVGDYYGSKMIGTVMLFAIAAVGCIFLGAPIWLTILIAIAAGLLGVVNPDQEIKSAIEKRKKAIFREMAWTLDRMAVVLETGLGFESTVQDIIWVSKGRGGLFMAILRDLTNSLYSGETKIDVIIERLRASVPSLGELDTFMQLVRTNLEKGQSIAPQLRELGEAMRDELTNEIETRRQAAELTLILITVGIIIPITMVIVAAPTILQFMGLVQ